MAPRRWSADPRKTSVPCIQAHRCVWSGPPQRGGLLSPVPHWGEVQPRVEHSAVLATGRLTKGRAQRAWPAGGDALGVPGVPRGGQGHTGRATQPRMPVPQKLGLSAPAEGVLANARLLQQGLQCWLLHMARQSQPQVSWLPTTLLSSRTPLET